MKKIYFKELNKEARNIRKDEYRFLLKLKF